MRGGSSSGGARLSVCTAAATKCGRDDRGVAQGVVGAVELWLTIGASSYAVLMCGCECRFSCTGISSGASYGLSIVILKGRMCSS